MSVRNGQRRRGAIAVITIVKNRRDHLARQRRWLRKHSPGVAHVIVDMGGQPIPPGDDTTVVDYTVEDGASLPLAAARNLGAGKVDADVLVFLDVDCLPTSELVPTYHRRVHRFGGVWSGPVGYLPQSDTIEEWSPSTLHRLARFHDDRPQPGQNPMLASSPELFWSLSFALSHDDFVAIGGFDESFVGYGAEDTDFARSASTAGFDIWFDGQATAFHQHHAVSSPPVEHLDDIIVNATRFHDKWDEWPMGGWLSAFADRGLINWKRDATEIVANW